MSNKYCKIGSMYMDLGIIQTRLQKNHTLDHYYLLSPRQ